MKNYHQKLIDLGYSLDRVAMDKLHMYMNFRNYDSDNKGNPNIRYGGRWWGNHNQLPSKDRVNRISFDSSSNFAPSGYSIGGYDVSGTLTSKSDDLSLAASVEGHSPVALDLDTGVYQILAPTCIIDTTSISFDEDGWKQSIPFKCAYTGATSSTIVSFAGTASDS